MENKGGSLMGNIDIQIQFYQQSNQILQRCYDRLKSHIDKEKESYVTKDIISKRTEVFILQKMNKEIIQEMQKKRAAIINDLTVNPEESSKYQYLQELKAKFRQLTDMSDIDESCKAYVSELKTAISRSKYSSSGLKIIYENQKDLFTIFERSKNNFPDLKKIYNAEKGRVINISAQHFSSNTILPQINSLKFERRIFYYEPRLYLQIEPIQFISGQTKKIDIRKHIKVFDLESGSEIPASNIVAIQIHDLTKGVLAFKRRKSTSKLSIKEGFDVKNDPIEYDKFDKIGLYKTDTSSLYNNFSINVLIKIKNNRIMTGHVKSTAVLMGY